MVTDTRRLRVLAGDEVVGDLPVTALVDECPVYDLEPAPPSVPLYPAPPRSLDDDAGPGATLLALLGSANVASRRPVFEQYDCIVGSRTARRPEQADAAVLMLDAGGRPAPGARGLDRRQRPPRRVSIPYRGAVEAVLECSANLACVGAEPLGLTNCLNFGNPEKPHIAWQLTRAVAGLGDACRALGVPVVGGNVSLYNEGGGGPIFPTPVVGMVGELPDAARAGQLGFAQAGDAIALIAARWLGAVAGRLRAGQAARRAARGRAARRRPRRAAGVHAAIRQAVRSGALRSAHDVAEGGARRRAGRVLRRRRAWAPRSRSRTPARRRCSARARARSSSPARARRSPRSAPRRG